MNCVFPNEPAAHFCANCGAPMTSYAATAPFESLFAEGHLYRQAAERPRSFVVVLGIWLLFGLMAAVGATFLSMARDSAMHALFGGALLALSLVMIWKTTRNYLNRPRVDEEPEA